MNESCKKWEREEENMERMQSYQVEDKIYSMSC